MALRSSVKHRGWNMAFNSKVVQKSASKQLPYDLTTGAYIQLFFHRQL